MVTQLHLDYYRQHSGQVEKSERPVKGIFPDERKRRTLLAKHY